MTKHSPKFSGKPKFLPKNSGKFVQKLKDHLTQTFKHDKSYPIKETHKAIDRYFRHANIMTQVRIVQDRLDNPYFKYNKFSEFFNERSQYEDIMKYLRRKSLIDENGKWKSTDKHLVTILKTIYEKGRFKKDISYSTTLIMHISKKYFLNPVNVNTAKRNPALKKGDAFDNL